MMTMKKLFIPFLAVMTLFSGALNIDAKEPVVKTGIEVLRQTGFQKLIGKRVGLVTNPSGVDSQLQSTIDILFNAPGVNLVALYGPEHGVRGDVYAGGHVTDAIDEKTGLPVYSLYGATRKPTKEMLNGIDIMVYDIQDVGCRSYTYISTLGLVMEACSELGIEVLVLDRPNPLGGYKIEGCYVEPGFHSFVSQYKIPYVYGLTVGELAVMINEEGMNRGQRGNQEPVKCKLTVVPMEGWTRDMLYEDTGLPWILPSPNIPFQETPQYYVSSGIFGELPGYIEVGVGYTLPFQTFAAKWIDPNKLKARLDSFNLPGVVFRTIWFKPFSGRSKDQVVGGVQFYYTDYELARVTEVQFYVVQAITELYPDKKAFDIAVSQGLFDKVCGTDYVRKNISKSYKAQDVISYWRKDEESFRALSQKYYIY
jgi:uncharacterized protein YbbC (DUF1343 family)